MKQRKFSSSTRSEEHARVIRLWKEGVSVQKIATELNKTRATIYAWIKKDEKRLGNKDSRKRLQISDRERLQIIESYILLKAPSMNVLSESLARYFHLRLSPSQLRRYLHQWGFRGFKPSSFHDQILKDRISGAVSRRKPRGDASSRV